MKKAIAIVSFALVFCAGAEDDLMSLMRAMYRRDMSNESGRVKWHGRLVGQDVRTNDLIKVSSYEDGYRFTNAFSVAKRRTIDPEILAKLRKRRFGNQLREFKLNPGDIITNSTLKTKGN